MAEYEQTSIAAQRLTSTESTFYMDLMLVSVRTLVELR
jgi:hypothetical protein